MYIGLIHVFCLYSLCFIFCMTKFVFVFFLNFHLNTFLSVITYKFGFWLQGWQLNYCWYFRCTKLDNAQTVTAVGCHNVVWYLILHCRIS